MRKVLLAILGLIVAGFIGWQLFKPKIAPYYAQLTRPHVGLAVDLQPKEQKGAHYVGSAKCRECHKEHYNDWIHSMHSKMIQDAKKDPGVIIADFSKLPADADFNKSDIKYTIGSKFK